MSRHPTQILLHNPKALRIEFLIDSGELILWWSPEAGDSFDCEVRNFSNRDDHLRVFEQIVFPGLTLEEFSGCDYDPYHSTLRFRHMHLHIAPSADSPQVMLWTDRDQELSFKTSRYDKVPRRNKHLFHTSHGESAYDFEFAAALGPGDGAFRHQRLEEKWRATYAVANLAPLQPLVIGVGLSGSRAAELAEKSASNGVGAFIEKTESILAKETASGRIEVFNDHEMQRLHEKTMRGLHSCIDQSGTLRASIKAIYYLVWIRDAAFCFGYQAAAGWPHRLGEWCRLMLENRLEIKDVPGIPDGRAFGQLVSRTFGKLEEDGIYYAVWSAFTHWTQTGRKDFVSGENLEKLKDSMRWVNEYIYDPDRGLFGSYFSDETPASGARDHGWDYAVGKPGGNGHIRHEGRPVARSYDIYCNLLMHATLVMLAAVSDADESDKYLQQADRVWSELKQFFKINDWNLPTYGELLLKSGERVMSPPYKPGRSVYVWALSLPIFAPVPGIDAIRRNLLEDLLKAPGGHWVNGLCSIIASLDTWVCPEEVLTGALEMINKQAIEPGAYLPMGGAIQEKCDAPQGNLFHDIRPQAFAQSSWLAAVSNLGVRRLPFGLAVRPSNTLKGLSDYCWRGKLVDFSFDSDSRPPALVVNGIKQAHTLQVPEDLLENRKNKVSLSAETAQPLLLRSSVMLKSVETGDSSVEYKMESYGPSELVFDAEPEKISLYDRKGSLLDHDLSKCDGLCFIRFCNRGNTTLKCMTGQK